MGAEVGFRDDLDPSGLFVVVGIRVGRAVVGDTVGSSEGVFVARGSAAPDLICCTVGFKVGRFEGASVSSSRS